MTEMSELFDMYSKVSLTKQLGKFLKQWKTRNPQQRNQIWKENQVEALELEIL